MPFQPGQSGNPSGRPKDVGDIRVLARQHAPAAVETLAAIMRDHGAQSSARVAAANSLLDRGYGKPVQEVSGPGGGALLGDVRIVLVKASAEPAPNPDAVPEPEDGAWS